MKRSSFQLLRDGKSGQTRYVSFRPWDASMECQIVGHHRLARKCLRQDFGKLLVSSSCVKRSLAGKELKAPVLFFSRKSKGCREPELQIQLPYKSPTRQGSWTCWTKLAHPLLSIFGDRPSWNSCQRWQSFWVYWDQAEQGCHFFG